MNTVKRYFVFLLGLFINSIGISMITKASLGTSPNSGIPYTLSLGFPLTMGQFTIAFNMFLILLQIILLRKNFVKIQYLQIVAAIMFGYFLDFSLTLLSWINPEKFLLRVLVVVIGCLILGLGVFTEVHANAIMLPGEGFVKAVAATMDKEFGITKVWVDASMTVIALVISLVMFRGIRGIGLGTIMAALITGLISNFYGKIFGPALDSFLAEKTADKAEELQPLSIGTDDAVGNLVITIGRQYGCRAAEIGKLVAQKLGISYYDKDLVDMVAEESGLTAEYVMQYQEKLTNSFLYDLYKQTYAYTRGEQTKADAMHYAEQRIIKRITEQEPCVIMGRVANYVLDQHKNAFHVFLYTTPERAVENVMEQDNLSRSEAYRKISQVNQKRSNYYRQYAKKEWGKADSYDLAINTGLYSVDKAADIIIDAIRDWGKL